MREAPSLLVTALRPPSSCTVSGLRPAALWRPIPARASPSSFGCKCALTFEHAAPRVVSRRRERALHCFPARFGIRYAKRNRRRSADLRAVRTGRPGDRFGEIAMTIFNEGRHAIRALGAALAATAGRAKNCFAQGLTRAEGIPLGIMPDRRIAGSPDRRIAGSPDRRIAGSPDRLTCVSSTELLSPASLPA